MNEYCVITTVNPPTEPVKKWEAIFGENLIVVGDNKTPADWNCGNTTYIPASKETSYSSSNHYTRKNIGYIEAIKKSASCIKDTDDDNAPNENWKVRTETVVAAQGLRSGWVNIYAEFTGSRVWPRGLPLTEINKVITIGKEFSVVSYIQQGLAQNDPDVDAIWRLLHQKWPVKFDNNGSYILTKNCWSPFNSQSTHWFPPAYPFLYLPVNCSMRMTDIWRSFVAQRCLWEMGSGVTFHSPPEVIQERNAHDLMKDFADEIDGYLKNDKIKNILEGLSLKGGLDSTCDNLLSCYEALVKEEILPLKEMASVEAWINAYEDATRNMG